MESTTPTPTTNAGPSSSAATNYNRASTAQFSDDAQLLDGSLVQSVGCVLVIQPPDFKILAYSENCIDMLGIWNIVGPGLIGTDARYLFTAASINPISEALPCTNLSQLNPLWLRSQSNHQLFCAVLNKVHVGICMNLEPVQDSPMPVILPGAFQSQKIAMSAISRLESLPGGNIGILCDAMVEEVQKLTGFDRVMVYKFHEDDHGEVLSEFRRADLEPYIGLHYPATDIPQEARLSFKRNLVRMICDCRSEPVKIIQSRDIAEPLCLINSTLRAPSACHVVYMNNMGSVASLVLPILVDDVDGSSKKLWGLVVCHHTSRWHVPFPLRYSCEFLRQAFSMQLQKELQLAVQVAEKRILRVQTLLCDMLLRDAPHGIITQSPGIMDLVKCHGAALFYKGKSWRVGITPGESHVKDLAEWLMQTHGDCTGLSTDCLAEAGCPGAARLGDAVCGMAAARISSNDFIFWFRSHMAKEVKWGGARDHPEGEDDGRNIQPRTSFVAFLEAAKSRSLPWVAAEINAVHSLQLIMRESIREGRFKRVRCSGREDELATLAVGMIRLIENASAPVFGIDSSGLINRWNAYMCELTGLNVSQAVGKSLVNDLVHPDSRVVVETLIAKALRGHEERNVEVMLVKFGVNKPNSIVHLRINSCTSMDHDNDVVGVCFVGQDITTEINVTDKFITLKGKYKSIIESVSPLIPPIFASDANAHCSEWNAVMENLTGYTRHETIGKSLPGEIFVNLCKLEGEDMLTKFKILLCKAIDQHEIPGKLHFGFYNRRGELLEMCLTVNKKVNESGSVIGCLCFLQTIVVGDGKDDRMDSNELAYLRQEIKNSLCGIRFTRELLQGSSISDYHKQFLKASGACEKQILSVIDNPGLESLLAGEMRLEEKEFLLGSVIDAIISQVIAFSREKNLQHVHDISEEIKIMCLCGDEMKLQLALSDFLICIANYAPSPYGWVELKASHGLKQVKDGIEFVHLQFRMVHPGQGLPQDLIEDMFGRKSCETGQGVALNISQKIVSKMNGNVSYIRDQNESYFRVDIELKTGKKQDVNYKDKGKKTLFS